MLYQQSQFCAVSSVSMHFRMKKVVAQHIIVYILLEYQKQTINTKILLQKLLTGTGF